MALKDIMPGELIVRESGPLLHIPKEYRSQSSGGEFMEVELAAYKVFASDLTRDQQEIILSLFGPRRENLQTTFEDLFPGLACFVTLRAVSQRL